MAGKLRGSFIQNVCDAVGAVALAKEGEWEYALSSEIEKPSKTISVGLDGTCMLMMEEGYRQAMVGTIALFDEEGERQFTLYTATTPGMAKKHFSTVCHQSRQFLKLFIHEKNPI